MISGTRKILFSIALILILLAGSAWAGQVLPALGGTTGGGTGALDAIYAGGDAPKYSALATGDICIVSDPDARLTSFYMFYIDDYAQSESAPFVILPDEQSPGVAYSGNGAWLMMSLSAGLIVSGGLASLAPGEDIAGELFLYEAGGTDTFTLSAPADITTSYTWTLPGTAAGGANYLINVDADGTMGYTDPATLGGGGGGTLTTLKEANTGVGDADIVTIDFGAGFDLTEDPNTEINVALDLTEYSGAAIGSTSGEITNIYMGDAAVIYMGADQDVSLTHVADTGIILNDAMQFQFRDSAIYIASLNDGYLDIEADTAIRMLGPVDMGVNALDCDSNTVTLSTVSGAIDAGGATSLEIPNSDDPDVDAAGEISWDTDGWMRAYDGSAQVAIARKLEEIHVTVVAPNDLADAVRDKFVVWSNESGMSFIVTGWKAWSGTDNTELNIEEYDADGQNNATVDAVNIQTDGTGIYTASDTSITGATIENGHLIALDFDDTDTPTYVKITIYGYYNADVN
ncbi:MAG TPA: hypothetical protein PLT30_12930 [Deltaproteobacteria bacterium]|nr:hypothetical protein [Deltaproteobacteria bacterium]